MLSGTGLVRARLVLQESKPLPLSPCGRSLKYHFIYNMDCKAQHLWIWRELFRSNFFLLNMALFIKFFLLLGSRMGTLLIFQSMYLSPSLCSRATNSIVPVMIVQLKCSGLSARLWVYYFTFRGKDISGSKESNLK